MAALQKNRSVQVFTPLGLDTLLFYQMQGKESLNEPFKYELELLSEDSNIHPENLLGENITIGVLLQDGNWRYFNGNVTRFGYAGNIENFTQFQVTVHPWLWFLTRNSNCRIFQNKKVPEIIKQVFGDLGFSDFKDKLSDSYSTREYCVQYRETDFNFVSRLMEEEGICYFFTHEKDRHYLVMTDSIISHVKFSGYEKIPFNTERGKKDKFRADHIYTWTYASEVQTGAYEMTDLMWLH